MEPPTMGGQLSMHTNLTPPMTTCCSQHSCSLALGVCCALQNLAGLTPFHSVIIVKWPCAILLNSSQMCSAFGCLDKSNRFFEENWFIVQKNGVPDTYTHFKAYLNSRDLRFHAHPVLWLHTDRTIHTRTWFIHCLCQFFPSAITGQSMCADGVH